MLLPDIAKQVGMEALAKKMSAPVPTDFALFNVDRQTYFQERNLMLEYGLEAPVCQLRALSNNCLAYKDCQGGWRAYNEKVIHIAMCERLLQPEQKSIQGLFSPLPGVICDHELAHGSAKDVCPSCLQALAYKGFDMHRPRHREYSQQVLREFSLEAFFSKLVFHPV